MLGGGVVGPSVEDEGLARLFHVGHDHDGCQWFAQLYVLDLELALSGQERTAFSVDMLQVELAQLVALFIRPIRRRDLEQRGGEIRTE